MKKLYSRGKSLKKKVYEIERFMGFFCDLKIFLGFMRFMGFFLDLKIFWDLWDFFEIYGIFLGFMDFFGI